MLYGYLVFTSIGWYLNYRSIQQAQEKFEREKGIISRELVFLKNQFNSHLTFNFLNYCCGKMYEYSAALAAPIDNFTEMLHYSFNNKVTDPVSLDQEVEYIENFITVQKALSKFVYVKTYYEGEFHNYFVLPLLFAIFVENSFKHGVFNDNQNPIIISLSANNGIVVFKVKNKKSNRKVLLSTGIGITNTKKILEIFYENSHVIDIHETETVYSCEIQIHNKF
jgi:two-component system LytT family sensor kinase